MGRMRGGLGLLTLFLWKCHSAKILLFYEGVFSFDVVFGSLWATATAGSIPKKPARTASLFTNLFVKKLGRLAMAWVFVFTGF
jgi:hypothetical protein